MTLQSLNFFIPVLSSVVFIFFVKFSFMIRDRKRSEVNVPRCAEQD